MLHQIFFRQSRDIMLIIRFDDGHIVEANDAAVEAYGYSREELLSLRIYELREPKTVQAIVSEMNEAEAGLFLFETVHRRKDGSTFFVEVKSQCASFEGVDYLFSTIRDISESKRSEEALRREQKLFYEENSGESIPIGGVGFVSDIIELKRAEEKLIKQKELMYTLYRATSQMVVSLHPDDVFEHMLSELIVLIDSEYGYIAELIYDDQGRPIMKKHAITNTTWNDEMKRFYKKNAVEEIEFRNFKNIFSTIISIGQPLISNKPFEDLGIGGLPEGWSPIKSFIAVPIFYGSSIVGVYAIANRPNGYNKEMIEFLHPFTSTCGIIINAMRKNKELVALQRELAEKNVDLERLNQEKNQFLGMVAHDLRSPLSVILAYSQFLQEEISGALTDTDKQFFSSINSTIEFMLNLINDLLDIAKIESGRLQLELKTVDLLSLIKRNIALNQVLAGKKQIKILFHCNEAIILLPLDSLRIEQVLNNLICNAIKFSQPKCIIEVKVIRGKDKVIISVKDEGLGIPSSEIVSLFKLFAHISARNIDREAGSGLGLAIARKIIEEHGGEIWVESEYRKGATFYFSLPVNDTNLFSGLLETSNQLNAITANIQVVDENQEKRNWVAKSSKNESEHTTVSRGLKKGDNLQADFSILIVDDDPLIIDYISMGLSYEGYQVYTALYGNDALELVRKSRIDAVILDWMLPDIQGLDLCRRLRELIDPVIIMLTGKNESIDRVKGLRAGADDYLVKPFNFDELLARLEAQLRRQRSNLGKKVLTYADITIWPTRREARRGHLRLGLTPTEYDLLLLFMRHPQQVLPKEVILQQVWGYNFSGDLNIVEVYIRYLRRKLDQPPLIHTIRGVGYLFELQI